MDIDEPGWPLIDDFFLDLAEGRTAETVRRYARVRLRLYEFLETGDMSLGLGTSPATLLDAERQFHTSGAFWSLFGAPELVCCLPSFLHPTWWPDGVSQTRLQIRLTGRLLTHLERSGSLDGVDVGCAFWEAEASVKEARHELERRSAATVDDVDPSMPARFLQQPGPEW